MAFDARIDDSLSPVRYDPVYDRPTAVESDSAVTPRPSTSEGQFNDPVPAPLRDDYYRGEVRRHDLLRAYESNAAEETLSATPESDDVARAATEGTDTVSANGVPSYDDFSQLGTAFVGTRPPQIFWNEASVNTAAVEGLRQGGLSADQAELNAELARSVLAPEIAVDGAARLLLTAGDLALIVRESGISFTKQDPNQLNAATSYLNNANDLAEQQERLRKTLDVFHTLDGRGLPQLTRDQMVGQLWEVARVPLHAIERMNNAELARTYEDVAAAVNGPAGQYKLKAGKHDVSFTVTEAHQVVNSKTQKPSVWGKIGRIALTVASFVPGPVGIAARIASSVVSAAEGIKNKNWFQAVVGGASGVAVGAGAIAGRAVSGAAATTARIADSVARGARAWQAGLHAARAHNPAGVFGALAGVGGAVARAVGDSAETVSRWARGVETWAGRAYVAAEARNISRLDLPDQLLAAGRHGANLILDSGDLRPANSAFEVKWKIGINLGQTVRAGFDLRQAIESGDVLLMSEAAAGLSATSRNSFRNIAAAPDLLNLFNARQSAGATGTGTQSDLRYDGAWIGDGGAPLVFGAFPSPIFPALPSGPLATTVPTIYVNGILNTIADQAAFMNLFANASGSAVYGIHNASQGIFGDIWQSAKDKLDLGRNPPVDAVAEYVYGRLMSLDGSPVNLAGHSQGALIISRALNDVKERLLEDGLPKQKVEELLGTLTVTTFGGASGHYPNGPQYFHYINRGDYVAMPGGLGGDLTRFVPLFHAGRGAEIIRFTDFSLPNAHDSKVYLNIYRRPQEFRSGRNPYTPDEMKRYRIGR
jgi:hypothetical protein